METKLIDVVYYIIKNYKKNQDLSNARLTKTVYLADWHQSIHYKKQITNIRWYFDHFGPFVWDIKNEIENQKELIQKVKENNKTYYQLKNLEKEHSFSFSKKEKSSLDHTITKTQDLGFNEFIRLIYSTYPIFMKEQYTYLNLVECAKEYNEEKKTWSESN